MTYRIENLEPAQQVIPWYWLDADALCLIFEKCLSSNEAPLKALLPLREVNHANKKIVESIVTRILKPIMTDGPSKGYLEQFGNECPLIYEKSTSKDFLKNLLYDHDCRSVFFADYCSDENQKEHITQHLEKLKIKYHNPCLRFDVHSLELLDQYRLYLQSKNVPFKPLALEIHLNEDFLQDFNISIIEKKAYYQKMEPLLTNDLQILTINIKQTIFNQITLDNNFSHVFECSKKLIKQYKENDGLNSEIFKDFFDNIKENVELGALLKEETPKLEALLFGKTLIKLSSFKLSFDRLDDVTSDDEMSSSDDEMSSNESKGLQGEEVEPLQRLMPNLRTLAFEKMSFKNSFIIALLESSLIERLESLTFSTCLFEDCDSIKLLCGSPLLSNLKRLHFPCFDPEYGQKLNKAIQKLGTNDSLRNLETLIFSDDEIDFETVKEVLNAIANNKSLKNLRKIKRLRIKEEKLFSEENLIQLKNLEHLKNFNFS